MELDGIVELVELVSIQISSTVTANLPICLYQPKPAMPAS